MSHVACHVVARVCVAVRGAKLRAAASVRSIQRGRQRSGTASRRAYPDCVADARSYARAAGLADARLICISDNYIIIGNAN